MSLAGVQTMKYVQREEDAAFLLSSSTSNSASFGSLFNSTIPTDASLLASQVGTPRNEYQTIGKVVSSDGISASATAAAIAHQTATSQFARSYTDSTIEKIRQEVANILSGDDSLDMDTELLHKDKSSCTSGELDMIRRERNRMHAKRTRLRKKKMLHELEAVSIHHYTVFIDILIYIQM